MTLRNSFRKRPPFPFSHRARAFNLPCDPKITSRGSFPTYFAEFRMFPGPQQIAVTGDNSFDTLFGRHWAVLFCGNNDFYLLQWDEEADAWTVEEDPLLTLPEFTGAERSFTAAFDQSARLIFAYETGGMVKVTRWDTDVGAYVQNVNFAGRDPALLMDASVTRRVPDSDVILFYVNSDRTALHYRMQRETYGTEHDLLYGAGEAVEYPSGVILDQAQAVPLRYELLVSFASGAKRPLALLSDPYQYSVEEALAAAGRVTTLTATTTTLRAAPIDDIDAGGAVTRLSAVATIYRYAAPPDTVAGAGFVGDVTATTAIYRPSGVSDELAAGGAVLDVTAVRTTVRHASSDALAAGGSIGGIRATAQS